jgi:hypothetical protein
MMKLQLFKGERIETPTERKPLRRILRRNLDPKDILASTEAIKGPGTTPTETGNTVSTVNCRTTRRRNVSKEF